MTVREGSRVALLVPCQAPAAPADRAPSQKNPAATQSAPAPNSEGVPVVHQDRTLFDIHAGVGSFTAQERAAALSDRLARLATDPSARTRTVTVVERGHVSEITSGDVLLMAVTEEDALVAGRSRQDVAADYAARIQRILAEVTGEFTMHAKAGWQELIRQYRVESAELDPRVFLIAHDNRMDFTLRYVVDYKRRRITKDLLFTRILEEKDKTEGRVALASATFHLVEAPELTAKMVAPKDHAKA